MLVLKALNTLYTSFELGSTAYQIHRISPFLKSKSTSDAKIPFIIHLAKCMMRPFVKIHHKPICNTLLQFFSPFLYYYYYFKFFLPTRENHLDQSVSGILSN